MKHLENNKLLTKFQHVKGHSPFLFPFCKVSQIRLQYLLVVLVVNRTVDGTVICKKTDDRLHVVCDVIYVEQKKDGLKPLIKLAIHAYYTS
jgi:hypothetical protein